MGALLVLSFAALAPADTVKGLATFTPGEVADANAVNANFEALRSSVDDNASRIGVLEEAVDRRSVSMSAFALGWDHFNEEPGTSSYGWILPTGVAVTIVGQYPRPSDYAGGGAVFTVYFWPSTAATSGVVDFQVRHRALECGVVPPVVPAILEQTGVPVDANDPIYCQSFDVPASALDGDLWSVVIRRGASESTYPGDVVLLAVKWEYGTAP